MESIKIKYRKFIPTQYIPSGKWWKKDKRIEGTGCMSDYIYNGTLLEIRTKEYYGEYGKVSHEVGIVIKEDGTIENIYIEDIKIVIDGTE